jgi:hypothetical protein
MKTFVGRRRELSELEAGLDDVRAGRGRLFFLTGEPGIGKTRLAEEIGRRAEAHGLSVAWGRCWETGGAPPFWPWIQALRTLGRARPAAAIQDVLAELEGSGASAWRDVVERRFHVFDAITMTLRKAAAKTPIAVVLDDLHWSDPSSLALLHFLSRQLSDAAICVLCTYRDRQARSSPELGELFNRLSREGTTLDLSRFEADDVRAFVEQRSRAPVEEDVLAAILATTEGLPLFVEEVVRALATKTGAAGKLAVPESVRDAIRARLLGLDPKTREILTCAAVLGREVDAHTLAAMQRAATGDTSTVPSALREAVAAGVVVETEPGVYAFAHGLVRDALFGELADDARWKLHARAAACLDAIGEGDAARAEIFAHLVNAGAESSADEIATAAMRAARRAMATYAFEDAALLLERAVPALEERNAAPRDVGEALALLGEARARSHEDAAAPCRRAAEIARSIDDPELLARAALALGAEIVPSVVSATLVELLSEASRRLPAVTSSLRARVLARLSGALQPAIDPNEPMKLAREAIAMARALGDRPTMRAVLIGAGSALVDFALPAERLEVDRDTLRLAEEDGDAPSAFRAHVRLFMDYLEIGKMQAAERSAGAVERLGAELNRPKVAWYACMMHAARLLQAGDFARAQAFEARADEIAASTAQEELVGLGSLYRCARSLLRGEDRSLQDNLDAFVAYSFGGDGGRGFEEVRAVFLLARKGEHEAVAKSLGRVPRNVGFTTADPVGMYMLSEALFTTGISDGAAALRDHLESRRGLFLTFGATGFVAFGPIEWLLARLASLAGLRADAERDFEGAIARCLEVGARPALAHVLIDYAVALERQGEQAARAKELRARAEALAAELGLGELALRARGNGVPMSVRTPSALPSAPAFSLVRDGDAWRVTSSERSFHVKDTRGMGMLAELVAAPGRAFHMLLLGGGGDVGDAGPMLDARAVRAYRDRLDALREREREADEANDPVRLEEARAEIEALGRELAGGLGLGGRGRRAASAVERARSNVQRRVKDAIGRIKDGDVELGQYLSWTVRTGTFCVFEPKIDAPKGK